MGRGARTKGYIKNLNTGTLRQFLYNPSSFQTARGASFSELTAPGMSYPKYQYVSGEAKELSVQLFLYSNVGRVSREIEFLEGLLPVEDSGFEFNPPPQVLFGFGNFIHKCIVDNLNIEYIEFHENLEPKIAVASISFKVVG